MRKLVLSLMAVFMISQGVFAAGEFIVSDIRVEGLQRISPGTVFNYLPIKVGDEVDTELSTNAVKALFDTGFFTDVELRQEDSVLIVSVKERPSIASIDIRGNKDLRDEAIEEGLDNAGFTEGRIFNQALLDRVLQEIRNQYFARGRYSATVDATVSPRPRNRVGIKIDIDEGQVARIKQIRVVGNSSFEEKELLDQFTLSDSSVFGFLSRRDKYSREKLLADTESLRSFYQDNGYLNFEIDSTDVSISQNKQDIFITIAITEGERFVVSDVQVESVEGIPAEELEALVTVKPGDVFSRRAVAESRSAIARTLADRGFAFAQVSALSDIDQENNAVGFTFAVDPGAKVYVRRIEITGNTSTRDEVIRREMRQLEGSVFSSEQVQRSRVRIQRLGFFDNVRIDTEPVPGTVDQLDLVVSVTEKATGSFLFGVGYSDADGVLVQASVNRQNLFGTGKEIDFRIDNSSVTQLYEIEYTDPYHTISGISRSFNLSRRKIDSKEANTAEYIVNTLSGGVEYRIPLSEYNSLNLSLDLEEIDLEATDETPPEFTSFIDQHPTSDDLKVVAGVGRDTRDSIFFPSEGYLTRASLEFSVPGSDLEYYKTEVRGSWYKALTGGKRTVLKVAGELGYGDGYGDLDTLPFFKNYYAGGPSSVRGFDSRSLGPRDTGPTPEAVGGNKRVTATVELLFPVPGAGDSDDKRFGLFVDAGQVFSEEQSIDIGEVRVSAGLSFNWFSPIGPLSISYGVPLNDEDGDDIENFQLSLGALFR
ncbi:MAG: outer membrane protein assembly factor BamA [marine bacterium B5-7]|nr:MAG: outer membrane protein assembly factor BamA [marine bacterium B5-7]